MIMERLSKAPPVKTFKRPSIWNWPKKFFRFSALMPEIGRLAIILKTAKIARTNKILFLKSFNLKIWMIFWNILDFILCCRQFSQFFLWLILKYCSPQRLMPWLFCLWLKFSPEGASPLFYELISFPARFPD